MDRIDHSLTSMKVLLLHQREPTQSHARDAKAIAIRQAVIVLNRAPPQRSELLSFLRQAQPMPRLICQLARYRQASFAGVPADLNRRVAHRCDYARGSDCCTDRRERIPTHYRSQQQQFQMQSKRAAGTTEEGPVSSRPLTGSCRYPSGGKPERPG